MRDDALLSYFKYSRKSNYKPGQQALGMFEDTSTFIDYFKVFIVNNTFISKCLREGKVTEFQLR